MIAKHAETSTRCSAATSGERMLQVKRGLRELQVMLAGSRTARGAEAFELQEPRRRRRRQKKPVKKARSEDVGSGLVDRSVSPSRRAASSRLTGRQPDSSSPPSRLRRFGGRRIRLALAVRNFGM